MNTDNNHLALSEEVNAAFAGLATLPDQVNSTLADQTPAPEVPASTVGRVRWLTDKKREQVYPLQFPFALGDVEYRTITVRRLSAGEVEAFVTKLRNAPAEEDPRLPMYFIADAEISDAAWNALDDDDLYGLTEASLELVPARFRRARASP